MTTYYYQSSTTLNAVYISPEMQERLDEGFLENFQDTSRTNADNGTSGDDTIHGGNFQWWSTIAAKGGNDTILIGNDSRSFTIYAGSGNDWAEGGPGDDLIYGGSGNDTLYGFGGHNTIYGGSGDDTLFVGSLGPTQAGDGVLFGGTGNDILNGSWGNDRLYGGADNDHLLGNPGNDELHGGFGNDFVWGGVGRDILCGDDGADMFQFDCLYSGSNHNESSIWAPDRVMDFSRAQGDKIDFTELDTNWDVAGFQHNPAFASGPSDTLGAFWITGMGADRTVYINTSAKPGAEMAIQVHLIDQSPAFGSSDFLL
jgi:Ca2+-binding RTX toxin-like protein